MSLDKDRLLESLLRYNYFPLQKKDKEELPPTLNSVQFTLDVLESLIELPTRKGGYDQVEYKVTRYNNVPRPLSIPHPLTYANLCHSLSSNWEKLQYITETENSLVIPEVHDDGRIIVMNYENAKKRTERHVKLSFNKKFYVNTDIANFFPSVYSHSIPWALVGFETAKKDRDPKKWFNRIDAHQRATRRDETNGIPIGPASSNIVCEIILARIDKVLSNDGFEFVRYIDDYSAYFKTHEKAEEFIRRLSEELSKYKLLLNIRKTLIEPLPLPCSSEWLLDITTRIPDQNDVKPTNIIRFLDYAVSKQASTPDGSVLKYAAKSIIYNLKASTAELVLQYLLSLCTRYPVLLPLLSISFEEMPSESEFASTAQLLDILDEHATNKRSDAMAWSLYYLNKFSQTIPKGVAETVINTKDCIAILFLYLSGQYDKEIVAFCDSLDKSDLFLLDQYWLLLYHLFFCGAISNPYEDKTAYANHLKNKKDTLENAMEREIRLFEVLKNKGVSFVEA